MKTHKLILLAVFATTAALADESEPVLRAEVSPRCALEIDVRRDERPACWRLDCVDAPLRELGCDLTELHQVSSITIAPDRQWMALISVGEGHPILEIAPLSPWLAGKPYRAQCTINPYPGTINIDRWTNEQLRLRSDVDLQQTQAELRVDDIGDERQYLLDPADCSLRGAAPVD